MPTAEYILAMKLMALRIGGVDGEKDRGDIDHLIAIVGIKTPADLVALAARYYPEARVSSKLRVAAAGFIAAAVEERDGEAPRYLDRGRSGKPPG